MKTLTYAMSAMFALMGVGLFAATPVAANCDSYGNEVNIGSSNSCEVYQNYCDGEAGPSGSGSGVASGIGYGVEGGEAEASANAGSSTDCDQCNQGCTTGNGTEGGGLGGIERPDLDEFELPDHYEVECRERSGSSAIYVARLLQTLLDYDVCDDQPVLQLYSATGQA